MTGLLPKDALRGICLGISVSESPDLLRLGLLETHIRLTLAEIARCVLVSGGQLAYGGHLEPDGYTTFLVHELERYSRRDRPLRIFLAWSEHRKLALSALESERRRLGLHGEIICLDTAGNPVDPAAGRNEASPARDDPEAVSQSLTALRRYMVENTHARVLIGGRREGFQGSMPGLLEEALLALEQGGAVYFAGGFGGVTLDIVSSLGIDVEEWLPLIDTPAPDERLARGMERLITTAATTGKSSLQNGLSTEENRYLAACHRPSEIATLVCLGLGRRFATDARL